MIKVPVAAKEPAKKIEWIVVRVLSAAALLGLLEAFMAVLVVCGPGLRVGEGFVRFRDLDKFFVGCFVASVGVCVLDNLCLCVCVVHVCACARENGRGSDRLKVLKRLTGSCLDGTFWPACDMQT